MKYFEKSINGYENVSKMSISISILFYKNILDL